MNYIELTIPVADPMVAEILVAELAELPFESFEEQTGTLKAYIPAEKLADCKDVVDGILGGYGITGARYIEIESQNWNAVWESHFEPVDVEGKLVIRAPFHAPATTTYFSSETGRCCADRSGEGEDSTGSTDSTETREGATDARLSREIIIMPQMSFGTGHHATTWLMSAEMLEHDFGDKAVLDMGSGTGVLAILAAKLGAKSVLAVDIDRWAFENAGDNIDINNVADIVTPVMGDVAAIRGYKFDTILANINRNILLADMASYVKAMESGGELLISGFFESDIDVLERRAHELGLRLNSQRIKEGWAVVSFRL